jgi:predicted ATPase/DNA-binding winged helix-turn-helix (wHTH) protein/tetratricopeptide (TPR) repeat protein
MAPETQSLATLRDSRIQLEKGWLDLDRGVFVTSDERIQLTATELKLIRVLLASEGEPLSRDTLHEEVWGYSPKIYTRAADQAIKRLRKKLERDPANPDHLQTAHGIGYRLVSGLSDEQAPLILLPSRGLCPTNLTPSSTQLLGREDLLKRLDAWYSSANRLATLVGPGGIGKTTAALAWAERISKQKGAPRGGIWCSELSSLERLDQVAADVAQVLDLRIEGAMEPNTVGAMLQARGPMLLILDNLDGLAPRAKTMLHGWLKQAPELKMLLTSRVRLGGVQEQCVEVGPLNEAAAIELLSSRIAAVSTRALESEDVAKLARALEGIPLAMELAAARCSLFSPAEITTRLTECLDMLARSDGSPKDRNATMRASISVSWSGLSPREQDLLGQCGVFRGGFDLEAADKVLSTLDDEFSVLEVLQQLRDKSLIGIVPGTGSARTRISILETVRAFAAEQPTPHDVATLESRHAGFFADRCEACFATDGLYAGFENDTLRPDIKNYRSAAERVDRLDAELGVRALVSLSFVLGGYSFSDEIASFTRKALDKALKSDSIPPRLMSRLWCRLGGCTSQSQEPDEGVSAMKTGVAIADEHGLHDRSVIDRTELFVAQFRCGLVDEALQTAAETHALAETHAPLLLPLVDYQAAYVHGLNGDPQRAAKLAWRAHGAWVRQGNRKGQGAAQYVLGHIALQQQDHAAAELAFSTAIDNLEEVGDSKAAGLHVLLGVVAMEKGEFDRAAEIAEASIELCGKAGRFEWLAEDLILLGQVEILRGNVAAAQHHLNRALTLFKSGVDRYHLVTTELMLALAHIRDGKGLEGRARLEACIAQVSDVKHLPDGGICHAIMVALIDLTTGAPGADSRARETVRSVAEGPPLGTKATRVILRVLQQELGIETATR